MTNEDLLKLLPGTQVVISSCEAREHSDNDGCVCHLKGTIQTVGERSESMFVGTPTWHLEGHPQRVRLAEITPLLQPRK